MGLRKNQIPQDAMAIGLRLNVHLLKLKKNSGGYGFFLIFLGKKIKRLYQWCNGEGWYKISPVMLDQWKVKKFFNTNPLEFLAVTRRVFRETIQEEFDMDFIE